MAKKKSKETEHTPPTKKFAPPSADEMTIKILTEKDLDSSPGIISFLERLQPDQIDVLTYSAVPPGFENFALAAMAFNLGDYLPAITILTGDGRLAAEMVDDTKRAVDQYREAYGAEMTFSVYLSAYNRDESEYKRILTKATLKRPLPDRATKAPDTVYYPTGRELSFFSEAINNVDDLKSIAARKKKVSHNQNYNYSEKTVMPGDGTDEKEIIVGKLTNSSTVYGSLSIIFDDIRKFSSGKRAAQKMLPKALRAILASPKADNGEPLLDRIAIPIEELVGGDHGYKTLKTARQGFMDGFNLLSMVKVDLRNMSGSVTDAIIQFFQEPYVKNNIGYVDITQKPGVWPQLLKEYASIPAYFDDLTNNAQMLLIYVITCARRSRTQFSRNGKKNYIDISYRAIQEYLDLPLENEVRNKRRDIIDPIHAAINEIKEREKRRVRRRKESTPRIDFETVGISSVYREKAGKTIPVSEYLENGKIRVYLAGDILEPLIGINEKQQKAIKEARRRKAKRKQEKENDPEKSDSTPTETVTEKETK